MSKPRRIKVKIGVGRNRDGKTIAWETVNGYDPGVPGLAVNRTSGDTALPFVVTHLNSGRSVCWSLQPWGKFRTVTQAVEYARQIADVCDWEALPNGSTAKDAGMTVRDLVRASLAADPSLERRSGKDRRGT